MFVGKFLNLSVLPCPPLSTEDSTGLTGLQGLIHTEGLARCLAGKKCPSSSCVNYLLVFLRVSTSLVLRGRHKAKRQERRDFHGAWWLIHRSQSDAVGRSESAAQGDLAEGLVAILRAAGGLRVKSLTQGGVIGIAWLKHSLCLHRGQGGALGRGLPRRLLWGGGPGKGCFLDSTGA